MEDLIKLLKEKGYSFVQNDNKIIIKNQGYVSLNGLTSLPDNVKFENQGDVSLNGLTSLPDNVKFENQGGVSLDGLTSLPDNVKFENQGEVFLYGLKTLPDNMFRNPKTNRILRKFNNIWYCGCFKGTTDELIEICKEKGFNEIIDWIKINK